MTWGHLIIVLAAVFVPWVCVYIADNINRRPGKFSPNRIPRVRSVDVIKMRKRND